MAEAQREDGAPDIGEALNGLLSDPDMLRKAMETASKLKESGLLDGILQDGKSAAEPTVDNEQLPKEVHGDRFDRHRRLLEALTPYLGEMRREKVALLLKLLRLLELSDSIGLSGFLGRAGHV